MSQKQLQSRLTHLPRPFWLHLKLDAALTSGGRRGERRDSKERTDNIGIVAGGGQPEYKLLL